MNHMTWLSKAITGKYFNTILARMYFGSWKSNKIKQDFKYRYVYGSLAYYFRKWDPGSLMSKEAIPGPHWTKKDIEWRDRWDRGNVGKNVNVFNASSFYCFVLIKLLNRTNWSIDWPERYTQPSRKIYMAILDRFAKRRTGAQIKDTVLARMHNALTKNKKSVTYREK